LSGEEVGLLGERRIRELLGDSGKLTAGIEIIAAPIESLPPFHADLWFEPRVWILVKEVFRKLGDMRIRFPIPIVFCKDREVVGSLFNGGIVCRNAAQLGTRFVRVGLDVSQFRESQSGARGVR
jgi:hypothetical protein